MPGWLAMMFSLNHRPRSGQHDATLNPMTYPIVSAVRSLPITGDLHSALPIDIAAIIVFDLAIFALASPGASTR